MTASWTHPRVREIDLRHLAELLAFALRPGDAVALRGDLGAGKSTLARAIIRAIVGDDALEVPSPTFSLVQIYDSPRFPIAHFDLYRLGSAEEARELGLDEQIAHGVALIEWPERAEELLPSDRIEVTLEEAPDLDPSERRIVIEGLGAADPRVARLKAISEFLNRSGWSDARLIYLQGDASARRFARLRRDGNSAILMDAPRQPDGPPIRDGKPYSRIAHLAEDIRPWVAVTRALRQAGLSAPEIYTHDFAAGLLLVEDLGDDVFGPAVHQGADQAELWRAAVDVLLHLREQGVPNFPPLEDGFTHTLPRYDQQALQIEVELLLDWYWPALKGSPAPDTTRAEYLALWDAIFDELLKLPTGWILRDYHSPNLLWMPHRKGLQRVGILDCQDALEGPVAYDLVSLLQDARIEVPESLERQLYRHYCQTVAAREPDFDQATFDFAYAALGAQRNTKILGIFARLSRRDGKNGYLRHIPRIWRYLERDLAHPKLLPLKKWFEANFPIDNRALPGSG